MTWFCNPFWLGFNPLSLFAAGETGLWISAKDLTTLFQNSNGTTAVTTTADPVGYWGDKSGNGKHCIQATGGARPTYSSVLPSIVFDGSNDDLAVASGLTATTGSLLALFTTGSAPFIDAAQVLISCADTGTANNWFEIGVDTVGRIYIDSNAGGTSHTAIGSTYLAPSTTYSLVVVHDGTDWYAQVNGIEENPLIIVSTGVFAWFGDVSGPDNTVIGGTITSAGLVRPWKGKISEIIVSSKVITA